MNPAEHTELLELIGKVQTSLRPQRTAMELDAGCQALDRMLEILGDRPGPPTPASVPGDPTLLSDAAATLDWFGHRRYGDHSGPEHRQAIKLAKALRRTGQEVVIIPRQKAERVLGLMDSALDGWDCEDAAHDDAHNMLREALGLTPQIESREEGER